MKVLANDGISESGRQMLESEGFEVIVTKVAQNQLIDFLNNNNIEVILVRSSTKIGKDILDACPKLKIIGRGGVGLDNIEVGYAQSKNIEVINTPEASSGSVAELVFAHLFTGARHLHDSNRNMPLEGDSRFLDLKRSYAAGVELRGKTLGIIGFGRIGKAVSKIALGLGMKVIASDSEVGEAKIELTFHNHQSIKIPIKTEPIDQLIQHSDFITLHVPAQISPILGAKEFGEMKQGVGIVNTARGGIIDEEALVEALEDGHVSFAALDTFADEPTPSIKILMNEKISLSPHIGAATLEAQKRIGEELATQIISIYQKEKA
ncbi:D-2-hydroxyacid dehydrogenase [Gramella sp. AN32]|uniref:D-2-hydroxyacid dehydrogenase n=1 Tax=Christiangramia antarctica TaxID=2058158 RepID=A0ABW5XA28_9FLAO|nr:D-2-hydroxyacid dehydrogenase [Gramella sp. AN32]MCM4157421.1 3-phosphoglycerate dehydrogenase [Gramella sp. AN32]